MADNLDKIRLDNSLRKEKKERHIYAYWIAEIDKRRHAGECPKCGVRKWYQLDSGFHGKWQCDKCGLVVTKQDVADGQKWWDYISLFAKDEIKRIAKARRHSQSVKTFERDEI